LLSNDFDLVPAEVDGDTVPDNYAGLGGTMRLYQGDDPITVGVTYGVKDVTPGFVVSVNPTTGAYAPVGMLKELKEGRCTLTATFMGIEKARPYFVKKSLTGKDGHQGADAILLRVRASRQLIKFNGLEQ